jgi:glucokinase
LPPIGWRIDPAAFSQTLQNVHTRYGLPIYVLENGYGDSGQPDQTGAVVDLGQIERAGTDGTCPTSRATIDMFCAMLGSVAGNLALGLNARGGIFIGGGILRHMPDYLAASQFRRGFEEKGRLRKFLEAIPAYLDPGRRRRVRRPS